MPATEHPRATVRSVAIPSEHGGWSLTLEPVVLGLLVVPSRAGWMLGAATLLFFVVRTPLKLVLVDRWRRRWLPRSRIALRVAAIELILIAVLVGLAVASALAAFWWPLLVAAPLVGVELWYDMRSRSRHLAAEVAGVIGVGAAGAMIVLAGGGETDVAIGVWLVTAARSVAAVGFVRVALRRAKGQDHRAWHSDLVQLAAVAAVVIGVSVGSIPWPAGVVVGAAALFAVSMTRRAPVPAYLVGAQQVVVGLTVVLVAGLAMRAW